MTEPREGGNGFGLGGETIRLNVVGHAFERPIANLHTMPFDIFLWIAKLKSDVEGKKLHFAVLPLSHVCRLLRQIVTSNFLFWTQATRISSKMPRDFQLICIERSHDALLDIVLECTRPKSPPEGTFEDLDWTLAQTVPLVHRWGSFSVTLCLEGRSRHPHCLSAGDILKSRLDVPNLHTVRISYHKLARRASVLENLNFDDVGDDGRFYANWRAPALSHLEARNYVPSSKIASTIKKLTLQFGSVIDEASLVDFLPFADSLDELCFVFEPGAERGIRSFWGDEVDDVMDDEDTRKYELPQICKVTVVCHGAHYSPYRMLPYHFRFPNADTFTIVGSPSSRDEVRIVNLVELCFPNRVDTIRFVQEVFPVAPGPQGLDICFYRLNCRRLEVVGDCWTMTDFERGLVKQVPEEVHLIACREGLAQLVRDVTVLAPDKKTKVVRLVDCSPLLIEQLGDIPPSKLEEWEREDFEKAYPDSRFRSIR